MSIKLTKHQVIPLRKSVKRSKLVCSFKDGFLIPINNASRFLIWLLDGAFHNIDQSNKCPIWFLVCCAGYDQRVGLLCSDQRVAVFLMVLLHNPCHTDIYSIFCKLSTSFCLSNETKNPIFLRSN